MGLHVRHQPPDAAARPRSGVKVIDYALLVDRETRSRNAVGQRSSPLGAMFESDGGYVQHGRVAWSHRTRLRASESFSSIGERGIGEAIRARGARVEMRFHDIAQSCQHASVCLPWQTIDAHDWASGLVDTAVVDGLPD